MHPRRAFTLVEMLLVVAIIALLISMLLPGMSSARSAARTAVCMTQQHQIHAGVATYVNENMGRFHPRRNWGRWYDNITTKTPISASHSSAYWGVAYSGTIGRDGARVLFNCPEALTSDQNTVSSSAALGYTDGPYETGNIYCTYGFNGLDVAYASSQGTTPSPFFNYGISGYPGRIARNLPNPSRTIMFQDAFEHLLDGNGDMPWSFTQWSSGQNREYFRHNMNRAGNVVWADGHIDTTPIEFNWTARLYSGQ